MTSSSTKSENVALQKAVAAVFVEPSSRNRASDYWQRKVHAVLQLKIWGAKLSFKVKAESRAGSINE